MSTIMTYVQYFMPLTPLISFGVLKAIGNRRLELANMATKAFLITMMASTAILMFVNGLESAFSGLPYNLSIFIYTAAIVAAMEKYHAVGFPKNLVVSYLIVFAASSIWEFGIMLSNLYSGVYGLASIILFGLELSSLAIVGMVSNFDPNDIILSTMIIAVAVAASVSMFFLPNFYVGVLAKATWCASLILLFTPKVKYYVNRNSNTDPK